MIKNKKFPLVSILMNCHNGEKYLSESIKSVLSQTYKNWELIFFDNLSTDNSKNVLIKFRDKRIKYYKSRKFLRLYQARNEAIKKTKGKYICFLDTDDIWKKNKINTQVNFMEKNNNYNIIYSNFYTFNQEKKKLFIQHNYKLPSGFITKKILKKYPIGILTACVKKTIFDKKIFKKKYDIIGDFDFFVNVSISNKIGCIQKPLAIYRLHDANFSKTKLKIFIKEMSQWIKDNHEFFKLKKINLIYQRIYILKLKFKYLISKIKSIF